MKDKKWLMDVYLVDDDDYPLGDTFLNREEAQAAAEKIFKCGYYSDPLNGPTLYIPVSAIRRIVVKEG